MRRRIRCARGGTSPARSSSSPAPCLASMSGRKAHGRRPVIGSGEDDGGEEEELENAYHVDEIAVPRDGLVHRRGARSSTRPSPSVRTVLREIFSFAMRDWTPTHVSAWLADQDGIPPEAVEKAAALHVDSAALLEFDGDAWAELGVQSAIQRATVIGAVTSAARVCSSCSLRIRRGNYSDALKHGGRFSADVGGAAEHVPQWHIAVGQCSRCSCSRSRRAGAGGRQHRGTGTSRGRQGGRQSAGGACSRTAGQQGHTHSPQGAQQGTQEQQAQGSSRQQASSRRQGYTSLFSVVEPRQLRH